MSNGLEGVVRPFATDPAVEPQAYYLPGQTGVPLVHVAVGLRGGTDTYNTSASASTSYILGRAHKEKPPHTTNLQTKLSQTT
jgi:hypothetical protein